MNTNQLRTELKNGIITPLYLFNVSDDYIGRTYLTLLRDSAADGPVAEMNITFIDEKKPDPAALIKTLRTMPILSKMRFVCLMQDAWKGNEAIARAVIEYSKDPCRTSVLVLYGSDHDKRTSLYKAFSARGKTLEIARATWRELDEWIRSMLAKKGFTIDDAAVSFFISAGDYTNRSAEVDLGYYVAEIEKLTAVSKPKKLTVDSIRRTIAPNVSEDIFALSDAIAAGNVRAAAESLDRLAYNRVFAGRVISEVARTMRGICLCLSLAAGGMKSDAIAAEASLHPFVAKKFLEASKHWSIEESKKALCSILMTDYYLKTGVYEPDYALQTLVSDICEKSFTLTEER